MFNNNFQTYNKAQLREGIWNWESKKVSTERTAILFLFAPLVLFTNLLLFASSEIILDIESLPDLLGRLPFDHVCYSFACHVQQTFNVQVVCSLWTVHSQP